MFGSYTYMYWLLLFIGLPILLLSTVQFRRLWQQRRALAWTLVGAGIGGWAWDALAVRLGAWYYKESNILNVWIGGLPLEEWLWITGVSLMFGIVTVIFKERNRHV